jgi:radical SAM superfamily enzyme YgiQ (UPF0313 family)
MAPRVLLVNPPIYDFTAYDFWSRPVGLLRVAGMLRGEAQMTLFDFLDRDAAGRRCRSDRWGRGKFPARVVPRPVALADVPRRFRRYGRSRDAFEQFVRRQGPFDLALVGSGMTYWYPGIVEVVETLRRLWPKLPIALGGTYASLCGEHAASLEVDFVASDGASATLARWLGMSLDTTALPLWEACPRLDVGVMNLTVGCPYRCSYCASDRLSGEFRAGDPGAAVAELERLIRLGARHVAFYDDALLVDPDSGLLAFLEEVSGRGLSVHFHTPNALHCSLLTPTVARAMVAGGFRTFYLGFESDSDAWFRRTGAKAEPGDLARAVENLMSAGADRENIVAYMLVGHPLGELQRIESSLDAAGHAGVRVMLAEFSPIPGTPDGDLCGRLVDLSEPLNHNKTAWSIRHLGSDRLQGIKDLARRQNDALG